MRFSILCYLLVGITILSCQQKDLAQESKKLNSILINYWKDVAAFDEIGSTSRGDTTFNHILNNTNSKVFRDKKLAFVQAYLDSLKTLSTEQLPENDLISYDILKQILENTVAEQQLNLELMPIQQFWGTHLTMMQFGSGQSDQPFKTVKDYQNFLGRINDFTAWCDSVIINMRTGLSKGYVLPASLTKKLIPQFKDQQVEDVTQSVFWGAINAMPKTFTADQQSQITNDYKKAIATQLVPCFKRMTDFLEKEYLPKSRSSSGYDALPNGKEAYEYYVKFWTTTNMTPAEIHELGLKEVARIRAEMEAIKKQVGFTGTLKEFFKYTTTDAKFKIFNTPEQVLQRFRDIHVKMEPKLKTMFNKVPKSKFEVRQTEKFREATASAEYMQGTLDGSRPGIFYTPIINAKEFFYPGMESLFLHEAIPGHHYQSSLQMENQDLPSFRRYYWSGAYGEGWALYCESLGKELGLYDDPYMYFGALGDEMHRAIRLVVDTGLHSKGWSREQAIQYSLDNEPTSLQGAEAEIERYMAVPGQALSYKIGALKIRALREKYEKKLGAKFKLATFHDALLAYGVLPLDILEKVMDRWSDGVK